MTAILLAIQNHAKDFTGGSVIAAELPAFPVLAAVPVACVDEDLSLLDTYFVHIPYYEEQLTLS